MDLKTAETAERLLKAMRENEHQQSEIHKLFKSANNGDQIALKELANICLELNQRMNIRLRSDISEL